MPNRDLSNLTIGERYWIARRVAGTTQAEMARRLRISEKQYNKLERDLTDLPNGFQVPKMPKEPAGHLCALARRRDGRGLRKLAEILGAGTHVTLLAWEAEGDIRLQMAWEKLGFSF